MGCVIQSGLVSSDTLVSGVEDGWMQVGDGCMTSVRSDRLQM